MAPLLSQASPPAWLRVLLARQYTFPCELIRLLCFFARVPCALKERTLLPKGLGNLGDLAGMMKQAMQMKAKAEEMKEKLADETVEASSGGGMVTVVMNGKFEVMSVTIDPEVIDRDEPEMLQTLVQAAVNEGVTKVQELVQDKMKELTGGLNIPGLT